MKKILSIMLATVICFTSICWNIIVGALEDIPLSLEVSDAGDGKVVVTVYANQDFQFGTLVANVQFDDSVFTRNDVAYNSSYDMGDAEAIDGFMMSAKNVSVEPYMDSVPADTVIVTYKFEYAKDAEAGDYEFALNLTLWEDGDFTSLLPENTTTTAVYTIGSAEPADPADGYTATIAGNASNGTTVRVNDTLKVDVGANLPFSATELTISYNKDLVSFTSASSSLGNVQVKDDKNGTLKLADYGVEKNASDKYVLEFTAISDGDASFEIASAAFGTGESAETADLTRAEPPEALEITIEKASFTVTLDPIFEGPEGVTDGEDYTFRPESALGAFYNYTLPIATLNNETVDVVANDDGTWTVKNVTGDLVITGSRTPKTYTVTTNIVLNGAIDKTSTGSATYGTDFTIVIPQNVAPGLEVGYNFALESVTVGGNAINVSDNVIPGAQVTGDIVISIKKEEVAADQFSVTINSSEVTADKTTVNKGESVTLTLTPEAGYLYEIQVNGTTVQFTDNKYTIENVQATVSVTVTKTLDVSTFDVDEYVQLSEESGEADNRLYLVTVGNQKIEGMTYTYNNQNMYWSSKYNAYAILVVGTTAPTLANATLALIAVNEIPAIAYDYNVNGTDTVDANDAQLVYNMYNVQYSDFTANVTMKKFLEADVNGDKKLDVNDAQAIINEVLGLSAN